MKGPLRATIIAAIAMVAGSLAALPASAYSLPSSTQPAAGEWRVMRPSSFNGTIASAVEQCERDAALVADDLLTPERCVRLRTMLSGNQCAEVMVEDGIVHDFMNGRQNGKSFVTKNVKKSLGRKDRALLCDLGAGVYAYWYTGVRGVSCNNIGISIVIPRMPLAPPEPPKPEPEPECQVVAIRHEDLPPGFKFLPGVYLPPGCCPECQPGMYIQALFLPDLPQEAGVTYVTVCPQRQP